MKISILIILICLALFACKPNQHNAEGVKQAMAHYDHLIMKVDGDSIALLFTPDGDLGKMAHGRDSIRTFLARFKHFKVLSQVSVTDSVKTMGDSAILQGKYYQTVVPEKDTIKVKGFYTATWLWVPAEGWRIKRMETRPMD